MTTAGRQDPEDRVSYALRIALYALCIMLPFVSLLVGVTTGERALMAAVTLLSAVGPMVAITQARKEQTVGRQAYAVGLDDGLRADTGPPGRHALEDPDERNAR